MQIFRVYSHVCELIVFISIIFRPQLQERAIAELLHLEYINFYCYISRERKPCKHSMYISKSISKYHSKDTITTLKYT